MLAQWEDIQGRKQHFTELTECLCGKGLKGMLSTLCSNAPSVNRPNTLTPILLVCSNLCLFPKGAWQDISLDFVEGLPKVDGYNVILVVVDRFTKYAHFIPLKHPYTALSIARVLYDNVIKLHGMPLSMVSDRDKNFTSAIWSELFKLEGVKLKYSTTYHPQTDGQTERVNQCLEMYLRCSISAFP